MNKKAQNLTLALVTAVMIFIFGMLVMNHLMGDITLARTVGLDCSDSGISSGTKLTCLGVDVLIPILILSIISLVFGAVLSRFII